MNVGHIDTDQLKGKQFVASYSGGKDSIFAIYKAMQAGLMPVGLLTTYNTDANRSWFHGVTESLLQNVSTSLAIPLTLIKTSGEDYAANFEKTLVLARGQGAEVCVFGDIDIEGHLEWCTQRCEKAGLMPYFPLWNGNRKDLVYEFIDAGFKSIITVVDTSRLPKEFLGKTLSREILEAIERSGADICGENGEYHTFAFDGPILTRKVDFIVVGIVERDNYGILSLDVPGA